MHKHQHLFPTTDLSGKYVYVPIAFGRSAKREINMRCISILTFSVMGLAAYGFVVGDDEPTSKTTVQPSGRSAPTSAVKSIDKTIARSAALPAGDEHAADEEAIRLTGDTYEKAYDSQDAKLIAAHFTEDAEYIDEQGNVYQGRASIEKVMSAYFADNPECQIEIDIESLRFVGAGIAIEDGTTTVSSKSNPEPLISRYTAVHVKTNGKWLAVSVRDHAPKDRRQHREQLEQLTWLQGDWVDECDDSLVFFSCESVDGGNFLLRKFMIQIAGQAALSGTQRIGWDPVTGKLRTWIFDSEGGYSDGSWHRDGNSWVLKSTGVTADGLTASGTSIYTIIDENTVTWQSVDHEVAGVQVPDSDLVTIVRRAPLPELTENPPSISK